MALSAGEGAEEMCELTKGLIATKVGAVVAPARSRGEAGRRQPRASQFRRQGGAF
jgi:hypothetical protein